MRNIVNLQLKPSITRALQHNTCLVQEPVSTHNATKRFIKIMDAKYDMVALPAIMRDNCSHLSPSHQEKLLSLLLKYESLFDGTLGDWNRLPVYRINEKGHAISWQTIPHNTDTHSYSKERDKQTRIYKGCKEAIIIAMGLSNIHKPKEEHDSMDHI